MSEPPQEHPPLVVAMQWTSRVTSIALEMVLPALGGYWLDQRIGTGGILMMVGLVLGFSLGLWQLLCLARPSTGGSSRRRLADPAEEPSDRRNA